MEDSKGGGVAHDRFTDDADVERVTAAIEAALCGDGETVPLSALVHVGWHRCDCPPYETSPHADAEPTYGDSSRWRCPVTAPQRIQLHRTKGWRKPEGAVVVARPSKWGNPFVVRPDGPDAWTVEGVVEHVSERTARGCAVQAYRHALVRGELDVTAGYARDALAGRDLACWCSLGEPCHADVLLEIANGENVVTAPQERPVAGDVPALLDALEAAEARLAESVPRSALVQVGWCYLPLGWPRVRAHLCREEPKAHPARYRVYADADGVLRTEGGAS